MAISKHEKWFNYFQKFLHILIWWISISILIHDKLSLISDVHGMWLVWVMLAWGAPQFSYSQVFIKESAEINSIFHSQTQDWYYVNFIILFCVQHCHTIEGFQPSQNNIEKQWVYSFFSSFRYNFHLKVYRDIIKVF